MIDSMARGFKSSRYASFNSISKAGGKLIKGAKGCLIEFFTIYYKHKETNKIYSIEQLNNLSEDEKKDILKIACPKTYVVFNSEQIENLSDLNLNITDEDPEEKEFIEQNNCENFISNILSNGNLNLQHANSERAFYNPNWDYIQLPQKQFFLSQEKYYSVFFHEVIHWTGHKERLNRELKGHNDQESYSFEELIAEMGAMLCCLQFGIYSEFLNSVRYLKSWLSVNSKDKETALREAFRHSKKLAILAAM